VTSPAADGERGGTVVRILIAPEGRTEAHAIDRVQAVAGLGLEGDRYHAGRGSFSRRPGPERQLTLIAVESLEWLEQSHGLTIDAGVLRRNLVTRGVDLNALVGRTFAVGEALLEGVKLCLPCSRIEQATGQPLIRLLWQRAGINARIVRGGWIAVGDPIARTVGPA
jgi:MOSC domain-containing protein YiiM